MAVTVEQGKKQFAGAFAKGMLVFELGEVAAVEAADDLVILPAALLRHRREQHCRNDELLLAHQHQRVAEGGVVGHREIRR